MEFESLKIKNILAIRNDRFGEFLLTVPALRALKETFKEAKITLVTSAYVRDLARLVKEADEVIVWDNYKHSLAQVIRFSKQLRRSKFDICVIFNPSQEFNLIAFLSGIPVRLGYNHKWPFLLTHMVEDVKKEGQKHEVVYNLDLVAGIGASASDTSLSLDIAKSCPSSISGSLGIDKTDIIAIHPLTSDPIKKWPEQNFILLANEISRQYKIKVVLIGARDKHDSCQDFSGISNGVIDLIDKTNLIELAYLLKNCKLLISCDSGPMHLAASVGTAVIALFRNDIKAKTALRWGPWGSGHTVIEASNLSNIRVDDVLLKVKEMIR